MNKGIITKEEANKVFSDIFSDINDITETDINSLIQRHGAMNLIDVLIKATEQYGCCDRMCNDGYNFARIIGMIAKEAIKESHYSLYALNLWYNGELSYAKSSINLFVEAPTCLTYLIVLEVVMYKEYKDYHITSPYDFQALVEKNPALQASFCMAQMVLYKDLYHDAAFCKVFYEKYYAVSYISFGSFENYMPRNFHEKYWKFLGEMINNNRLSTDLVSQKKVRLLWFQEGFNKYGVEIDKARLHLR